MDTININPVQIPSVNGGITANENFGGSLRLAASDHLYLASDLVVGGSISADIISAETRVNVTMDLPHTNFSYLPLTSVARNTID